MTSPSPLAVTRPDCSSPAKAWRKLLAPYAKPDAARAAGQLLITLALLVASSAALLWGLAMGFWPALVLALPAALFIVRLFIIQHDCGHGSYFRSGWLNDAIGRTLGVVTMMPYAAWRRDHAVHHATCGDLGRRGTGDVTTLTVAEYRARSYWGRLTYRLYRHPLVLFVLGPIYVLVRYRVPLTSRERDRRGWLSVLGTNAAAAALCVGMTLLVGPIAFLAGWGTVLLVASAIGVWLFYIQHQFQDTYWRPAALWDFHTAAFEGSSFYDLPRLLHWFTGSIGFHHIHHLASRIPNYRLRACFEENLELRQGVKRVTLWGSLKTAHLALWDESAQRLVSFRQAARAA
ncbi:MAG TPA: fatty acid desaturase [Stellaceae bacterium]|nr:fatty acid desaturase [Stellaceae bacterium]